jgi:hypothetical protein
VQRPDLFWSFADQGGWLTRRGVLYGYLCPYVPCTSIHADALPAIWAKLRHHYPDLYPDVAYPDVAWNVREDSLIPYSEMAPETAEAMAVLAIFRFFRQAYHAHRGDRVAFVQCIDRLRFRLEQLAPLAVHEESRPYDEAHVSDSILDDWHHPAYDEATAIHDQAVENSDSHPDSLREIADAVPEQKLKDAARRVKDAEERLGRWASGSPAAEHPDGQVPVSPLPLIDLSDPPYDLNALSGPPHEEL